MSSQRATAAAAAGFVAAWHRLQDGVPRTELAEQIALDDALHRLIVAVDRYCTACDPGTCPYTERTADVIDAAGRI